MKESRKPLILFDTDMDTDCDDVGALALIYEYVRRGRAELLGIVADVVSPCAAACCEALGRFYGINRPVGTIYASEFPEKETSRYVRYRAHSEMVGERRYNRKLAVQIHKNDRDYPSALRVYRELLVSSMDKSVTVVCVGLLTALDRLLSSPADDISPLSGEELMERKVIRVISMGYPAKEGPNFNWDMDAEGAQRFLKNCPVPVYVSGDGSSIITGVTLSKRFPSDHPLRYSYETFTGEAGKGRSSWDLIATLYALEPENPLLQAVERGTCTYDPAVPRSYWQENGTRSDHEIVVQCSDEEMAAYLEKRMTGDFE